MPRLSKITIDKTAVGAADYTSTSPPTATVDNDTIQIKWGTNALSTIPADSLSSFQTGYRFDVPANCLGVFIGSHYNDDLLYQTSSYTSGSNELIVYAHNYTASNGSLGSGEKMGELIFLNIKIGRAHV